LIVVKAAYFFSVTFHDGVTKRDLAITTNSDFVAASYGYYRGQNKTLSS